LSQLSLPFIITGGYLIKKNRQALPYPAEDRETEYAKQMKVVRLFSQDNEYFTKTGSYRANHYTFSAAESSQWTSQRNLAKVPR
jgi:hypothetical protein